jgi:rhodanese-related sulfurtransferase
MPNSAPQAPGHITVTDAYDRARANEAVLLDVREADEYSAGHAPGSRSRDAPDLRRRVTT